MTHRKTFFSLVLLLVCTMLVTGTVFAQEPVTVVVYVGLGTGTAPAQIEAQDTLAARFNAEHDDVQIEIMIAPHDEADTRLLAMLTDGETAPGLVGPMGVDFVSGWADAWADVTPFVEAEDYDLSDFYPAAVSLLQLGDKSAGLPFGLYPSFLIYSVDAFDAAGVEYPPSDFDDETWTFAALRDMAMRVTLDENYNDASMEEFDPDNIIQWGYDDSWINFRGMMAMWDAENVGRPSNDDYTVAVANSPEWVAGAQWFSDGMHVDHFIPDAEGQNAYYALGDSPLDGGMVAMFYTHTWYLPEVPNIPFEIQLAPAPFNPSGTRVARIHADVWAIPEIYPHKEAAWEVMKWINSEENITEVCMIYGCVPGRISAAEEHRTLWQETYPGLDIDLVYESINYLDNPHHESFVPEVGRVEDLLENAFGQILYGENTNAQEVLDAVNAEVQAILDENQ
jgi:multiple sugar transport system substrate-binding protein